MTKMRRKGDLPRKPCATCGRPIVWRRKWAKVWEEVRHCSERCRHQRRGDDGAPKATDVNEGESGKKF